MKDKMPLETRRPPSPAAVFPPRRDFVSLSIRDLLDARDAYHVYLASLDNVVATAVGRYFIHEDDWYAQNPPGSKPPAGYRKPKTPRTLANSVIRPWSWPAVLVFVKQWENKASLGSNAVPPTLYLSDGRVVPTCVIEATPDTDLPSPAMAPFPTTPLLGAGYSCVRDRQGQESAGTFACLVAKGGAVYALTNRHVAGGEGEVVRAYVRGGFEPVGVTSNLAVDRVPIPSVFPTWPYPKSLLTVDAGLVRVHDVNDWTSQAFGIGEIGELFDATEYSLTLDLIGTPVRAFNSLSGDSRGEIRALFFRFESVGGFDYVTDVLIGPRSGDTNGANGRNGRNGRNGGNGAKGAKGARGTNGMNGADGAAHPFTHPGDSGTTWFYDPPADASNVRGFHGPPPPPIEHGARAPRLRPLAMQWGGQRVRLADGQRGSYALATFLSSICRALDVELVRNWSLGHEEFWGKIGHFSIGWKACDQLSGNLGLLMTRNQPRIGFDDGKLSGTFSVDRQGFVPLADVPDYVWVSSHAHPNESVQHFADIDIEDINGGPSLLELCHANPNNIAASVWKAYFDGFARKGVGPEEGALPFRVWQIYDAMVDYLTKRDVIHFVAAAGVLAHYVGDASQPLHCSFMHHGVPPMTPVNGRQYPFPRTSPQFEEFKSTPAAAIHGIYEEGMLEIDPAAALASVDDRLKKLAKPASPIKTGHDAAVATLRLMYDAQSRLSPLDIINADDPSLSKKKRAERLWNNETVRDATVQSLAESVMTLAAIWEAAWHAGNGAAIPKSKLIAFAEDDLEDIYRREKGFIPSLSLAAMVKSKKFEP